MPAPRQHWNLSFICLLLISPAFLKVAAAAQCRKCEQGEGPCMMPSMKACVDYESSMKKVCPKSFAECAEDGSAPSAAAAGGDPMGGMGGVMGQLGGIMGALGPVLGVLGDLAGAAGAASDAAGGGDDDDD